MNIVVIAISVFAIASADFLPRRGCQNTQFECDNGSCVEKERWCYSCCYCSDRSDYRNCSLYPNCAEDQIACHARKKCIPFKWGCDGFVDCPDRSDETDCWIGYKKEVWLRKSKGKARSWLLKQRRSNYGWESRSHRVIAAIYLSNTKQFYPGDYESKLMKKQLQLYLSQVILKGKPIPTHEIALYVHSLLSTCVNPRNFQYRNFVQELKESEEKSDSLNAFSTLVLCNANATLSPKYVTKLREFMNQSQEPGWTEQQAYALMAMKCIQKRREKLTKALRTTYFFDDFDISEIISNMKSLQRSNGSFGSLLTTAIVMQALHALGDSSEGWDIEKAFLYLISQQKNDGSFDNDILTTYLVLPVLNEKSLLDLGNVSCPREISDLTAKDEMDTRKEDFIKLTYTIFVGLLKDITFSITFTVPHNSTFFDAMRLAEELDARYRFKYTQYQWGIYVYSLFRMANDPEAGMNWKLYQISENRLTSVNEAPDKLVVRNNGKYIYWYEPRGRKVETEEMVIEDNISVEP